MSFVPRAGGSRRWKFIATVCVAAGIFLLLTPVLSNAGPATEQLRGTVEKVQGILQDARLKPETQKKQRRVQLRQVMSQRFDFGDMAKRSLGIHWPGRTPAQQAKFVKLYTDLLEDAYLDQIEPNVSERFVYLRETRDRDFAEVVTKVIPVKGEELAINYRLRSTNGNWKIYDLVIENVSVVNNYRSQFNRILNGSSFDELLERLRETRMNQVQAKKSRPDSTIVSAWLLAAASPARPH
ncbi:MAG TPA: ABC transporter substrate-binding protein [Candidatus Binatia bacterium]|jgi:phospholipid transport system substrate-binding protein